MELSEKSMKALNKIKSNLNDIELRNEFIEKMKAEEQKEDMYIGGRVAGKNTVSKVDNFAGKAREGGVLVGDGGNAMIEAANKPENTGSRGSNPRPNERSANMGDNGGKPENVGKPDGKGGKPELTGLALASEKSGKDLLSKLTNVKELGKALKPKKSTEPMQVDIALKAKGLERGKGAAKFIRRRVKRKNEVESFLGGLFGSNKTDVSKMSYEEAMNAYDSGVKSGTLNTDGTRKVTAQDVVSTVNTVGDILGGLGIIRPRPTNAPAPAPVVQKKDNTMMYVGLASAVVIVIVVLVMINRKK
jgi:hypothetical protein